MNYGEKSSTGKDDELQIFPHVRSYDQSDALTFKIMMAEAKLLRLILESHGFIQTETNDWNLLWTCTSS
jgi:Tubulin-tyrosine ligase family